MTRTILTRYRALCQRYTPQPRRPYEYPVNRYYAHRIDPLCTWVADHMGLSPNAVTLLALSAGLGAGLAIGYGHYLLAALLIQLHHLLDGVDGNLARYHQRCSAFGQRLDRFSDQVVRLSVFVSLAWVADVPAWLAWGMLATIYLDLAVVQWLILPYARRQPLVRDRWKQWFMDRGMMPAFDIFTLYLIVTLCLLAHSPEIAVVLVAVLKTLDWNYRLYEVVRTALTRR